MSVEQKDIILESRIGGLGSSDALMCYNIGRRGFLSESDTDRIAVMLGLKKVPVFATSSTLLGDRIETQLFNFLKDKYPNIISNPTYKSDYISEKYGFDVFNHIDYEIETENEIIWVENKAVVTDIDDTVSHYLNQLAWHHNLLRAKALELGKTPVFLMSHYDTKDFIDISEMTPEKWTLKNLEYINFDPIISVIEKGLQIIRDIIPTFVYVERETMSTSILPQQHIELLNDIAVAIKMMDAEKKKIDDFKQTMYDLMVSNNIKSLKHEGFFTLTVVGDTVSVSFDTTTFKVDHPDLYAKYSKTSPKKGFLKITQH